VVDGNVTGTRRRWLAVRRVRWPSRWLSDRRVWIALEAESASLPDPAELLTQLALLAFS